MATTPTLSKLMENKNSQVEHALGTHIKALLDLTNFPALPVGVSKSLGYEVNKGLEEQLNSLEKVLKICESANIDATQKIVAVNSFGVKEKNSEVFFEYSLNDIKEIARCWRAINQSYANLRKACRIPAKAKDQSPTFSKNNFSLGLLSDAVKKPAKKSANPPATPIDMTEKSE